MQKLRNFGNKAFRFELKCMFLKPGRSWFLEYLIWVHNSGLRVFNYISREELRFHNEMEFM